MTEGEIRCRYCSLIPFDTTPQALWCPRRLCEGASDEVCWCGVSTIQAAGARPCDTTNIYLRVVKANWPASGERQTRASAVPARARRSRISVVATPGSMSGGLSARGECTRAKGVRLCGARREATKSARLGCARSHSSTRDPEPHPAPQPVQHITPATPTISSTHARKTTRRYLVVGEAVKLPS